jgi:TPR repeat protein
MLDEIIADIAVPACAEGIARSNAAARPLYEYGRALMAKRNFSAASREFEQAVDAGYPAARVDLGMLLSEPSAGMLNIPRAISLYRQAWKDGVAIAAFDLGSLYEHGVRQAGSTARYMLAPDKAKAWSWYQKAADAGEPNALARFGEREDHLALAAQNVRQRDSDLLRALQYYASASERARLEDWPDDAWRTWRYRRASLARILARAGMMTDVAREYRDVRKRYAPPPPLWQRLATFAGFW